MISLAGVCVKGDGGTVFHPFLPRCVVYEVVRLGIGVKKGEQVKLGSCISDEVGCFFRLL